MAEASDTMGMLRANLCDAGCDDKAVTRCVDCARDGAWEELLSLLAGQRAALLRAMRTSQRQIDCLDYLVYQIRKNHTGG